MKPFPLLPSLAFCVGTAVAVAQERPPGPPPPPDPAFEAALDDCWVDLEGAANDPAVPELLEQCMADKGFRRPTGAPPPPGDGPPPHPPPHS